MSVRLAVFLGNPGSQYRNTRHNAGWMVLDALADPAGVSFQNKFKGSFADYAVNGPPPRKVHLLKPETYMNRSGESVQPAVAFYRIAPAEIIVVHDEIELPFGTLSIRLGGGLGGHNGLRSIAGTLGTREFARLRIGVGRPKRGDVSSYVLGRFTPAEEAGLPHLMDRAAAVLLSILGEEPVEARAKNILVFGG